MAQITSLILFAVAVVFYTVSQAIMHGKVGQPWRSDRVSFWSQGAHIKKYKYVNGSPIKAASNWYTKLFQIKYKERFPLSATILVSFTDGYHLMQLLFKLFLCAAIVTYEPIFGLVDAVIYFVLFGICFTITYRIVT